MLATGVRRSSRPSHDHYRLLILNRHRANAFTWKPVGPLRQYGHTNSGSDQGGNGLVCRRLGADRRLKTTAAAVGEEHLTICRRNRCRRENPSVLCERKERDRLPRSERMVVRKHGHDIIHRHGLGQKRWIINGPAHEKPRQAPPAQNVPVAGQGPSRQAISQRRGTLAQRDEARLESRCPLRIR